MLYHPCANPIMVNKLRKLVTGCIRKHVIARDSMRLTEERPLALIAWGVRMTMNFVDTSEVIPFIMVTIHCSVFRFDLIVSIFY